MKKGFTLIELLVVIMIMTLLFAIVAFGTKGARDNALDNRRRADLSAISSGLERYKSDCGKYPSGSQFTNAVSSGTLKGNDSKPTCRSNNVYIKEMPLDPSNPNPKYSYKSTAPQATYSLCASLSSAPVPPFTATQLSACSSCGGTACNYIVTNP